MAATLESLHHVLLVDVVEGLLAVLEPNSVYLIQKSGAIRTTCLIIIFFHLNTFEYLVSHEFS